MATIEQYEAFVETIDKGSLTAAATGLRRSLQSVSRAIASLEEELGVELLRRTTRRQNLTPAGDALYRRLRVALHEIRDACSEARSETARVGGVMRIGASVLFAPRFVVPAATAFMRKFVDVKIEIVSHDALADLLQDRLDIAVRIGSLGAATLKSKKVGQIRRVVVATPAYLERYGYPKSPADLSSHRCVVRTFGPEGDLWPFHINGQSSRVAVGGDFHCDEGAAANAAVLCGAGIGLTPLWQVRREIDDGRLKILLSEFEAPPIPVSVVWPGSVGTPIRTRLFIEKLASHLSAEQI